MVGGVLVLRHVARWLRDAFSDDITDDIVVGPAVSDNPNYGQARAAVGILDY